MQPYLIFEHIKDFVNKTFFEEFPVLLVLKLT